MQKRGIQNAKEKGGHQYVWTHLSVFADVDTDLVLYCLRDKTEEGIPSPTSSSASGRSSVLPKYGLTGRTHSWEMQRLKDSFLVSFHLFDDSHLQEK